MNAWLGWVVAGVGAALVSISARAGLIYYDGQTASSTYVNTTYVPQGLNYMLANGTNALQTSGGKRVTPGTGEPGGNDTFDLALAAGGAWDQAGLYDAGTGTVGGGDVSGVLYVSCLVRSTHAVSGATENKDAGPQGAYAAFLLSRSGSEVLGMGNHWWAWAYSIYGITNPQDLILGTGGTTWQDYNTSVHLMVAKIVFHPGASDDVTVWLDPNPDDGDAQLDSVRRYAATGVGDASFNQVAYKSGNISGLNSWEFDEVRFATDWASVAPARAPLPIYYDAQRASSPYLNTAFDPSGLGYTMASGQPLPVGGGKRVTSGTGVATGTDTVSLDLSAGGPWGLSGFFDSASGTVGGGDVDGVLYVSCLVRAHYGVGADVEWKPEWTPYRDPPYGAYAGVQLDRAGTVVLGLGNAWNAWAYSIFGVWGTGDLIYGSGPEPDIWFTYLAYDTAVHMLVAKITFKRGADDEVTVWLDPDPGKGDNQINEVRRASASGDMSFNRILYGSGDIPALDGWDFDEVRMSADWRGVITSPPLDGTILRVE